MRKAIGTNHQPERSGPTQPSVAVFAPEQPSDALLDNANHVAPIPAHTPDNTTSRGRVIAAQARVSPVIAIPRNPMASGRSAAATPAAKPANHHITTDRVPVFPDTAM